MNTTCAACSAAIALVPSYTPRDDGLFELRYVVDQDALREHLISAHGTAHGPAPRPALSLAHGAGATAHLAS